MIQIIGEKMRFYRKGDHCNAYIMKWYDYLYSLKSKTIKYDSFCYYTLLINDKRCIIIWKFKYKSFFGIKNNPFTKDSCILWLNI